MCNSLQKEEVELYAVHRVCSGPFGVDYFWCEWKQAEGNKIPDAFVIVFLVSTVQEQVWTQAL